LTIKPIFSKINGVADSRKVEAKLINLFMFKSNAVTSASFNSTMERETISKNRVIPKNLRSRGNICFSIFIFCFFVIANASGQSTNLKQLYGWEKKEIEDMLKKDKKIKNAIDNALKKGRNKDSIYIADFIGSYGYIDTWISINKKQISRWSIGLGPTETYKKYEIIEIYQVPRGVYNSLHTVGFSFIPKEEYAAFDEKRKLYDKKNELADKKRKLANLGLSDDNEFLYLDGTKNLYFAYRFSDDMVVTSGNIPQQATIYFEHTKDSYGYPLIAGITNAKNYKFEIPKLYENYSISSTCFETGRIPIYIAFPTILINFYGYLNGEGYIEIPQRILEKRKEFYQIALNGTIYDILKYEEKYKKIDPNITILNVRKDKMLYTTEFFDEQTEKYKKELYIKEYSTVNNYKTKKDFVQKYAAYDPSKYCTTILTETPMIYLDKLVRFEEITKRTYSFFKDYWFYKSVDISEYYDSKEIVNKAISGCEQDINSTSGKCRENLVSMLGKLNGHLSYIESCYKTAQKENDEWRASVSKSAREYAAKQCDGCEINWDKTSFAYNEVKRGAFGIHYTKNNPGKIVMKNKNEYEFYLDSDGKYWITGFFSGTTFDTPEAMVKSFLEQCRKQYCN
jgi:hypothetical protein